MVGPVGLEPTTKGFTLPEYFYSAWTISSPTTLLARARDAEPVIKDALVPR